jgi:lysophospholipase L1-like esterase/pimeloyl-ACP methyl ester carboxylesterase
VKLLCRPVWFCCVLWLSCPWFAVRAEQLPDGRITFVAPTAADTASWEFKPTRWGRYDVEAIVSAAAAGSELQVEVAGQVLTVRLPANVPGTDQTTVPVGRFYLAKSDPFTVRAGPKPGSAGSFTVKAITLRPAPEGDPVVQQDSGEIAFRADQATTHSVMMRYEPATNKNCLGYWVNPADWADWSFTVTQPGTFEVEVLQGCGKGQGGSDVNVEVGATKLPFVVQETGHFQIFVPRVVGRVTLVAGTHTLALKPQRKQAGAVMDVRQVKLTPVAATPAAKSVLNARRVVFLGDSITYAGEWVEFVEAYVRMKFPEARPDFINLGLPSETVSGLSEDGHAGGAFPRPDLHERLGRVLEKAKPDLVIACYGMNDGIYLPFDAGRFQKFQDGIQRLRERCAAAGAKVLYLTPPTFDEVKGGHPGYGAALDRYSEWLVGQRAQGWEVVDTHTPMNRFLAERRRSDPSFLLAGDGVHVNTQGHWLIAREMLRQLGAPDELASADTPDALVKSHPRGAEILKLVQQRQRVLKDAWLTHVGHVRPGMGMGKPLADAEREAAEVAAKLNELTNVHLPGKRSVWFGFDRYDFEVGGKSAMVIAPEHEAPGRPWVWHGEFFGHKPNPDLALLGRGFHVVYLSVPDMLGSPGAVKHWDALYAELTGKFGFAKKVALVGLSRGGLYCYNWAAVNPDKVACLYGDAPVCDFRSWPGAFGKGKRSDRDWQLVLEQYGFKSDDEAKAYARNPVDNLAPLAAAKVPLLHVFGDADEVVPWDENTGVIAERYPKLGGDITLIRKPGVKHHPHGLDDSTPIVDFLWQHAASADAKAWLARHGGGPLDADGRPLIRKLGTIDLDLVETTPVVLNGRLWRFEWVRQGIGQQYWANERQTNYFRFRDPATGEVTAPFADGHEFGSAFVHDGTVYVTGTQGRGQINVFAPRDLKTWETWTAVPAGRYGIFNTSICKAGDEFVLMFEIDKPAEEAGVAFTARFAKSRDLRTWTMTPPECNYAKDRYTAPHALRWLGGWFYNFYLEAYQGYEMRVVRSRDLVTWEASPLNPILRHAPEDKLIANASFTDPQRTRIALAKNLNNSDIDFCEWLGRLVINYSWGNQQGVEHLAEAVYDGTEAQFLRGWFPEK